MLTSCMQRVQLIDNIRSDIPIDNITLRIMTTYTEQQEDLEIIGNMYTMNHPGIKVEFICVPADQYRQAIRARLDGAVPPAIFVLTSTGMASVLEDKLEDLSEIRLLDSVMDDFVVRHESGKVIGIPISLNAYGFLYNRKIIQNAGLNPDNIPILANLNTMLNRLDEIIAAGELSEEYPDLVSSFAMGDKNNWAQRVRFHNLVFPFEISSMTEGGRFEFYTRERVKTMLEIMLRFDKAEIADSVQSLADNQTAVIYGNALDLTASMPRADIRLAPAAVSSWQQHYLPIGAEECFAVNSDISAAEKNAAKNFLEWLFTDTDAITVITQRLGWIPPYKSIADRHTDDDIARQVYDMYYDGRGKPLTSFAAVTEEAGAEFNRITDEYISGRKEWDDSVREIRRVVNAQSLTE